MVEAQRADAAYVLHDVVVVAEKLLCVEVVLQMLDRDLPHNDVGRRSFPSRRVGQLPHRHVPEIFDLFHEFFVLHRWHNLDHSATWPP